MFSTLSVSLVLIAFLPPLMAQFTPEAGWIVRGQQELNYIPITEIKYDGECPGKEDNPSQDVWFYSSQTTPAPGRRVVVRNVTRGLASDPYPYTDREYEEGRQSERARMTFGTEHRGQYFVALDGENQFEYEIKQNDLVIESGSFTAVVDRIPDVRRRDARVETQSVCANSAVSLYLCADIRTLSEYICPNNRVIRTVVEPDFSEIKTLVSNQTRRTVDYTLNGRIYRLSTGQDNIHTANSLRIVFEPGCYTQRIGRSRRRICAPAKFRDLQLGKRYKFSVSPNNNSLVELIEFPRL